MAVTPEEQVDEARAKAGKATKNPEPYFQHYWSYATLWRNWVVGIAAGALFILLNKDVGGRFEARALIASLFVSAAGFQVLLAWINKTAHYYEYRQLEGKEGWWVRSWANVTEWYAIDFTADLASLILVGVAVGIMIRDVIG